LPPVPNHRYCFSIVEIWAAVIFAGSSTVDGQAPEGVGDLGIWDGGGVALQVSAQGFRSQDLCGTSSRGRLHRLLSLGQRRPSRRELLRHIRQRARMPDERHFFTQVGGTQHAPAARLESPVADRESGAGYLSVALTNSVRASSSFSLDDDDGFVLLFNDDREGGRTGAASEASTVSRASKARGAVCLCSGRLSRLSVGGELEPADPFDDGARNLLFFTFCGVGNFPLRAENGRHTNAAARDVELRRPARLPRPPPNSPRRIDPAPRFSRRLIPLIPASLDNGRLSFQCPSSIAATRPHFTRSNELDRDGGERLGAVDGQGPLLAPLANSSAACFSMARSSESRDTRPVGTL